MVRWSHGVFVGVVIGVGAVAWAAEPSAPSEPTGEAIMAHSAALADVTCEHCHANPHPGNDAPCASCHTAEVWSPTTFTTADHAALAFPLEGRHVEVACGRCHVDAKLTGLPTVCSECHVDRHRGKLGEDCTECHTVEGFRPVEGFDHDARTGFVLTGHHGGLPCEGCHEGANGSALRLTLEPTCATCHAESHARFSAGCAECHTLEQPSFLDARKGFDHRPTSFALERRHRSLGCADCHAPGETRPPQPQCRSCHTDPHSGQLGKTCSDCHRPDRWSLARFDHDRTAWPLKGRHFVTPCASCHTNQRWMGLRTECSGCHAIDALRGPRSVPAHRVSGADCADCHGTWTWR